MGSNKTATLTIRIEPNLKESLRVAAEREHRSIANMVEMLIRDFCELKGIKLGMEKVAYLPIKDE